MTGEVIPLRQAQAPDTSLPIRMAGGPLTCSRCQNPIIPTTWHVFQDGVVCPECAVADPALWIWQHLCDIYDQIDDLMVAADDAHQRKLLASLIAQEAPYFAQWREEPSAAGEQP